MGQGRDVKQLKMVINGNIFQHYRLINEKVLKEARASFFLCAVFKQKVDCKMNEEFKVPLYTLHLDKFCD